MAKPLTWSSAKKLRVVRGNGPWEPADLEPGVKFFVLMLEKLGCTTLFSCEGHPTGFYIAFAGPERVARRVERCGYMNVEVSNQGWRLSLRSQELMAYQLGAPLAQEDRDRILRAAARNWNREFAGSAAREEARPAYTVSVLGPVD